MTVDLLPEPELQAGGWFYGAADIPAVVAGYQRWVTSGPECVPDQLSTSLAILRPPDLPTTPEALRGRTVAHLRVAFVGGPGEAEPFLAPLRALGTPILGGVEPLPYGRLGTIHGDPTTPAAHAAGGLLLRELTSGTVAALESKAGPTVHTPLGIVEIRHLGGVLAASTNDAVGGRDAAFGLWVSSQPYCPDETSDSGAQAAAAVRGVLDAVAPWSTGGAQVNFSGAVNTPAEMAAGWNPATARQLAAVRRSYDL